MHTLFLLITLFYNLKNFSKYQVSLVKIYLRKVGKMTHAA